MQSWQIKEVIARLKDVVGVKNDRDLSIRIGYKNNAIQGWGKEIKNKKGKVTGVRQPDFRAIFEHLSFKEAVWICTGKRVVEQSVVDAYASDLAAVTAERDRYKRMYEDILAAVQIKKPHK